jgi:hypothetical protein
MPRREILIVLGQEDREYSIAHEFQDLALVLLDRRHDRVKIIVQQFDDRIARQSVGHPPSRRARARAREAAGNQRPWPADKVERWSIDRLIPYAKKQSTMTAIPYPRAFRT